MLVCVAELLTSTVDAAVTSTVSVSAADLQGELGQDGLAQSDDDLRLRLGGSR